jgi:hypothetical protein
MSNWIETFAKMRKFIEETLGANLKAEDLEELKSILTPTLPDAIDALAGAYSGELWDHIEAECGRKLTEEEKLQALEILKENFSQDFPAPGRILTPREEELRKQAKRAKKFMTSQVKAARYADKLWRMGHPKAAAALMNCSTEELDALAAKLKPMERTEFHAGARPRLNGPWARMCGWCNPWQPAEVRAAYEAALIESRPNPAEPTPEQQPMQSSAETPK